MTTANTNAIFIYLFLCVCLCLCFLCLCLLVAGYVPSSLLAQIDFSIQTLSDVTSYFFGCVFLLFFKFTSLSVLSIFFFFLSLLLSLTRRSDCSESALDLFLDFFLFFDLDEDELYFQYSFGAFYDDKNYLVKKRMCLMRNQTIKP